MNTDVTVLLPERRNAPHPPIGKKRYPVLYLLHGHSQDHSMWSRNSQLEFYAQNSDFITVMPHSYRGFSTDAKHGLDYFTYLTEELPTVIRNWFPASLERDETFVAGLSMGGYGALKCGLRRPDIYAGAAALSPSPYGNRLPYGKPPEGDPLLGVGLPPYDMSFLTGEIFGTDEEYRGSINDLEAAVIDLAKSCGKKPKILQYIGTKDFLLEQNREFSRFVRENGKGIDYEYEEYEGYCHNWEFWNKQIVIVLEKFGLL